MAIITFAGAVLPSVVTLRRANDTLPKEPRLGTQRHVRTNERYNKALLQQQGRD